MNEQSNVVWIIVAALGAFWSVISANGRSRAFFNTARTLSTFFCRFGSPGRQMRAIPLQTTAVSSTKAHSGWFSSGSHHIQTKIKKKFYVSLILGLGLVQLNVPSLSVTTMGFCKRCHACISWFSWSSKNKRKTYTFSRYKTKLHVFGALLQLLRIFGMTLIIIY